MENGRKDKILDVATRVFSRKGYRLTDVQEIADILKVGKGTIYRCFKSKRNLFTSVIERGMYQLLTKVHQNIKDVVNPLERLRLATQTHIEFFSRNMDLVELFIQERSEFRDYFKSLYLKYYPRHIKKVEKTIQECINKGLIKPINPKGVTSVLTDLYYGMLFTSYLDGKPNTLQQKGRYILDVFIQNILRKEGNL
jgi:AcrR family transcriptional regulator